MVPCVKRLYRCLTVVCVCVCGLRSVSENAKARFPPHVDCYTAHSLAYRAVGWKYEFHY